jgi:hypothetical protein
LGARGRRISEFEASLQSEHQDSQGYSEKPCLQKPKAKKKKKKEKRKKIVLGTEAPRASNQATTAWEFVFHARWVTTGPENVNLGQIFRAVPCRPSLWGHEAAARPGKSIF